MTLFESHQKETEIIRFKTVHCKPIIILHVKNVCIKHAQNDIFLSHKLPYLGQFPNLNIIIFCACFTSWYTPQKMYSHVHTHDPGGWGHLYGFVSFKILGYGVIMVHFMWQLYNKNKVWLNFCIYHSRSSFVIVSIHGKIMWSMLLYRIHVAFNTTFFTITFDQFKS